MVTSERRTRGDVVAAVLIIVAVLVAAGLVWRFSDARATVSEPAIGVPPAPLVAPTALPPSFGEVWSAPSSATPNPVVAGATVVTADGREVVGRDPLTGERRWRYARDIDVCTAAPAWGNVVTAWSKDPRYCSEVTALGGDTGKRVNQRNGDAERGTRLLFDGSHATAVGGRYFETWRSDLVRTTQYGAVPATVNPGRQPRTGCSYASMAAAANLLAVVERCPGDSGDRLTVLKANPKEAEQPEVVSSVVLSTPAALVVAMTATRVAVLKPGPTRLAIFDDQGNQLTEHPVTATLPDTADGRPAIASTTVTTNRVYWFTGSSTVAFDPGDLRPLWTVDDTLGPGAVFAGRLLVPVPGELLVLDAGTGDRLGSTPVDRGGHDGPVQLASAGSIVLEQRGDRLVALR